MIRISFPVPSYVCADAVGPGPTRGRGIAVGATHHGTEEGTVLVSILHTAVVALIQQCSAQEDQVFVDHFPQHFMTLLRQQSRGLEIFDIDLHGVY